MVKVTIFKEEGEGGSNNWVYTHACFVSNDNNRGGDVDDNDNDNNDE